MIRPPPSGELHSLFLNEDGSRRRQSHKWHHYFEIYERHFARFRGQAITFVEIGIAGGGSLEIWQRWFGPRARIVGLDINPDAAANVPPGCQAMIGDQADPAFLRRVLAEIGPPDIVVDDGGHTANQQITSFEVLYPAVRQGGLYLVEDTHAAFFGGHYADRPDGRNFMDFACDAARALQDWSGQERHFARWGLPPEGRPQPAPEASAICRQTHAISFHDSVVVFERRDRQEPWHETR